MENRVLKTIVIILITFFIVPLHTLALEEEEITESTEPTEEVVPETIKLEAIPLENEVINLSWNKVEEIDYYKLYKYDYLDNILDTVTLDKEKTSYDFNNLISGFTYKFKIEAYKTGEDKDILLAESNNTDEIKAVKMLFEEEDYRSLKNFTIKSPKKLSINLRKRLNEKYNGYSTVQGGCTDGVYAYYLLISKYNDKGRILKVRISDNATIKTSSILNIVHGNGMTCNPKTKKIVISQRSSAKNTLSIINSDSLILEKKVQVDYSNYKEATGWKVKKGSGYNGIAAISYVEKYDMYVALQRNNFDLLVLNNNYKVVGYIDTKISDKYKGVYQAMDADEKYVYLVLSSYDQNQPNNIILAIDWNSENILDLINTDTNFIEKSWICNNSSNGLIDAVVKINGLYEAENLYHLKDKNGKNHFYVSEYKNVAKYHWVTYKIPYKVKWKKVKKKVKYKKFVGYKKVKVKYITKDNKIKYKKVKKKVYKTKYKKKKVWKYKTKYKKKKVYEFNYYKRNGYVYDLGTF